MTFQKLTSDSSCVCIDGSLSILISDIFCRRLSKEKIGINDFKTYWELGKFPNNKNDCKKVCDHKSLSLHKYSTETDLIKFYQKTISFRPELKAKTPFYCRLRFNDGAGKGKNSPSNPDRDHYSIFKSDLFNLKSIFVIEIKEIP
jgi:hypothetical protein